VRRSHSLAPPAATMVAGCLQPALFPRYFLMHTVCISQRDSALPSLKLSAIPGGCCSTFLCTRRHWRWFARSCRKSRIKI